MYLVRHLESGIRELIEVLPFKARVCGFLGQLMTLCYSFSYWAFHLKVKNWKDDL